MESLKLCNGCKQELSHKSFHKGNGKFGLRSRCKICVKSYKARKGYHNEWYEKNKEKQREYKRNYYQQNIDKCRLERAEFDKNNKQAKAFREAKRRAKKLNATLPGFDDEIKNIYLNCPDGYHVDHIMPLQGVTVSGLHVPWNLQYLPATDNLKKSNKLV